MEDLWNHVWGNAVLCSVHQQLFRYRLFRESPCLLTFFRPHLSLLACFTRTSATSFLGKPRRVEPELSAALGWKATLGLEKDSSYVNISHGGALWSAEKYLYLCIVDFCCSPPCHGHLFTTIWFTWMNLAPLVTPLKTTRIFPPSQKFWADFIGILEMIILLFILRHLLLIQTQQLYFRSMPSSWTVGDGEDSKPHQGSPAKTSVIY